MWARIHKAHAIEEYGPPCEKSLGVYKVLLRGDAFQARKAAESPQALPPEPCLQLDTPLLPSQVKAFYGDEAESILISNLKRGVVSLLQLQPHAGAAVEVGAEPGPGPARKPGTTLQQAGVGVGICFTQLNQQPANGRGIPPSRVRLMLQ